MKYFGTDGIRGRANVLLTPDLSFKVGAFLGGHEKRNKIMLAMDTRISGPVLLNSLVAGILSSGGTAHVLGVAPTPALAYLCKKHKYDYGIMISASHNPFPDNGIKIFDQNGFKISAELEALIEKYIASDETLPLQTGEHIGHYDDVHPLLREYVSYVQEAYTGDLTLKLLVDGAHGSASSVITDVLAPYKLRATIINIAPNGININENCGSTHLDVIQKIVKDNPGKYDLGVAFDGDADRVLFVGPHGELFDGDYVLYLLGKYYHKRGALNDDTVVVTVMANYGLNVALDALNIKTLATDVGDKYVQQAMVEHNYLIGGEQSGHTIFNGFIKTGDGIYTLMKVLHVLAAEKTTFGEYTKAFKKFPQKLINVKVNNKAKALSDKALQAEIAKASKRLSGHGRVLIRASGTEELIRVMVEAETESETNEVINHLVQFVK